MWNDATLFYDVKRSYAGCDTYNFNRQIEILLLKRLLLWGKIFAKWLGASHSIYITGEQSTSLGGIMLGENTCGRKK